MYSRSYHVLGSHTNMSVPKPPPPRPSKGKGKKSKPKRSIAASKRASKRAQRTRDMTRVMAPIAVASVFRPTTNASGIRPSKNGGIIFPRRTFLGTVATLASGAFNVQYYTVNPGLPNGVDSQNLGAFSWIQGMATLYDRYRIRKMRVDYITSTNTTLSSGDVMMMFDYDVNDLAPVSEATFLNTMGAVTGPVWGEHSARAVPKLAAPPNGYKVRNGTLPSGGTYNEYDFARLWIGTVGGINNNTTGRLFLDYEIELFLPTA